MSNKPVAWMSKKGILSYVNDMGFTIPLYTHPVNPKYDPETGEPLIDGYPLFSGLPHPAKEPTDEEIIACIDEIEPDTADMIRFARAILRKAQENVK